jgi:hypothetical protein
MEGPKGQISAEQKLIAAVIFLQKQQKQREWPSTRPL